MKQKNGKVWKLFLTGSLILCGIFTFAVFAEAATLSVQPANIKVGEKAVFSFDSLPGNAQVVLTATKPGAGPQSQTQTTNSAGALSSNFVFLANTGEEGTWTAVAKISVSAATTETNSVSFTVQPAQSYTTYEGCLNEKADPNQCCIEFSETPGCQASGQAVKGGKCTASFDCQAGLACVSGVCSEPSSGGGNGGGVSGKVSRTLQQGMTGDDVKILQQALYSKVKDQAVLAGLKKSSMKPDGTFDGVFGPDTDAAVFYYKQENNLTPFNGIAGPETLTALGIYDASAAGGSTGGTGGAGGTGAAGSGGCLAGLESVNGLCLPPSQFKTGLASSTSLVGFLVKVVEFLLTLAGVIAVLVLIVGGFWYVTSAGNEEMAEKGKKSIMNAIIGLVVITLSYAIVTILNNTLIAPNLINK